MNIYIKFSVVLFLVVAISCGLLAFVNKQTKPIIQNNEEIAQERARKDVVSSAHKFVQVKPDSTFIYYRAIDINDNHIGYSLLTTERGYSGDIQVMVGLNTNYEVLNIKVISQTETPGLGTAIVLPKFTDMFKGLKQGDLKIERDGGKIKNITGATISTKAVTRSVNNAISRLIGYTIGGEDELFE